MNRSRFTTATLERMIAADLVDVINHRFGVHVGEGQAKIILEDAVRLYRGRAGLKWTDDENNEDNWDNWLRIRLSVAGLLPIGGNHKSGSLAVPLHVFFIYLEETEEQLARLFEKPAPSRVARSKLATTNLAIISPVDSVAAKVSHTKQEEL